MKRVLTALKGWLKDERWYLDTPSVCPVRAMLFLLLGSAGTDKAGNLPAQMELCCYLVSGFKSSFGAMCQ